MFIVDPNTFFFFFLFVVVLFFYFLFFFSVLFVLLGECGVYTKARHCCRCAADDDVTGQHTSSKTPDLAGNLTIISSISSEPRIRI